MKSNCAWWLPNLLQQTNTCSKLALKSPVLPQCCHFDIFGIMSGYVFSDWPEEFEVVTKRYSIKETFWEHTPVLVLFANFTKFLFTLLFETSVNGCFWRVRSLNGDSKSLLKKFQVFTMKATVLHTFNFNICEHLNRVIFEILSNWFFLKISQLKHIQNRQQKRQLRW